MNEDKIKLLEERNKQLAAKLQTLSTIDSQLSTSRNNTDDEIDLSELWTAIWEGKWLMMAITAVFSIASVLYALSVPNEYKATALLTPASSSSSSSLSKLAGQLGGLASLAGVNLGGGGGVEDKTVVAMEIIKTWGFLEAFIKENNLEVEVFAAIGWNRSSNQLLIDSDLYNEASKQWVRDFNAAKGQKAEPSSWELFEKIEDKISISQDKTSGLISLSVDYFSPIIAKQWVDKMIVAINAHVQKQDREEALKNISYLNKKINETNLADMQSVFYQLIEDQTKTLMLAEVSDEYVLKTLSHAKIEEKKSKPRRALIVLLGVLIGIVSSLIFVITRYVLSENSMNEVILQQKYD